MHVCIYLLMNFKIKMIQLEIDVALNKIRQSTTTTTTKRVEFKCLIKEIK